MTDADLTAYFDRFWSGLCTLGLIVAAVLGLVGLAFAALVGGWWGVFMFACVFGCSLFELSDWYKSRALRARRSLVSASPHLPTPNVCALPRTTGLISVPATCAVRGNERSHGESGAARAMLLMMAGVASLTNARAAG